MQKLKKKNCFIINNAYVGSDKSTTRLLETNGKPHERQKQKLFKLTTTRHLIEKPDSLWY